MKSQLFAQQKRNKNMDSPLHSDPANMHAARPQPSKNGPRRWSKASILPALIILAWLLLGHNRPAAAAPRLSAEEAIQIATQGETGEDLLSGRIGGAADIEINNAAAGLTLDEVGPNDFQISQTGNPADFDDTGPAAAYNGQAKEYFVVWSGTDEYPSEEGDGSRTTEIYGRRIDAQTGEQIGDYAAISDVGDRAAGYHATNPAIAYNSTDNEYLIVWTGDDNAAGTVDNEYEVFGQRLSSDGAPVGDNDFRISDMGPDNTADAIFRVRNADVIYNPTRNEYLVAWEGVEEELTGSEIYIQRLDSEGKEIGLNDFRISYMEPDDGASINYAKEPSIAYNSKEDEYVIVWEGSDAEKLGYRENEIYGRRLWYINGGSVLMFIGPNFRISTSGPEADVFHAAADPAVAYNETTNQYLAVWSWFGEEEDTGIYGRLFAPDGTLLGNGDFAVSDRETNGHPHTFHTALIYNDLTNEFLAAWQGRGAEIEAGSPETEIFGRRLSADGAPLGSQDIRISDMGPDGDRNYTASNPALAANSDSGDVLVVWTGDDDQELAQQGELDIHGQLLGAGSAQEIGANDFRISPLWRDLIYDVHIPAVAYNSRDNDFLVAWVVVDNSGPQAKQHVVVQLVDAPTGRRDGRSRRISSVYVTNNIHDLALVYDAKRDQYLAVWADGSSISGQLLNDIGGEIGANDFAIDADANEKITRVAAAYNEVSDEYLVVYVKSVQQKEAVVGSRLSAENGAVIAGVSIGSPGTEVADPAVAYNSQNNEYLVVWNDEPGGNDLEILGQRLNAVDGSQIGDDDFQISPAGSAGTAGYDVFFADVVHNPEENEYLVVWQTSKVSSQSLYSAIHGQRLNALTGVKVGQENFQISDMDRHGNASRSAFMPRAAYGGHDRSYLVVWTGNSMAMDALEFEIYGQALDAAGQDIGADLRLSDMGPDGSLSYQAHVPAAAAYSSRSEQFLVIWPGMDDTGRLAQGEVEVFGQFVAQSDDPSPMPQSVFQTYMPAVIR